jgi:hypothetical protein
MEKATLTHKQHQKKIILTSIAVGAAGVLGYFGWQFYKKRKSNKSAGGNTYSDLDSLLKTAPPAATDSLPVLSPSPVSIPRARTKPASSSVTADAADNGDFPLRKGSKGDKVRQLQKALLAKYGKSILPKYGADGDFGSETAAALKKTGLSASVDESTFNVLTQTTQTDGASLGADLYNAAQSRDFGKVISVLKKMTTTADYATANNVFRTYRLDGVRQTIVNGLLRSFTSEDQQQQIKFEFLRIGLQFNGNKWSLSGLGGLPIITVRPATVWLNAQRKVQVPARVVLGNEISKRLDYTLFENQGQYFLVPTYCIRYI